MITREQIIEALREGHRKYLEGRKKDVNNFTYEQMVNEVMTLIEHPPVEKEEIPEWEQRFTAYLSHNSAAIFASRSDKPVDDEAWMEWRATPLEIKDFIRSEFEKMGEEIKRKYTCFGPPGDVQFNFISELIKDELKERGVV